MPAFDNAFDSAREHVRRDLRIRLAVQAPAHEALDVGDDLRSHANSKACGAVRVGASWHMVLIRCQTAYI